jgi:FKBP-type peptidyl-prolyl cis-trans isomerase
MNGVKTENQVSLNNETDSLNYFLGVNMGYSLETAPFEIDGELLASGLLQVTNDSSMYNQMTADAIFRGLHQGLQARQQVEAEQKAMDNLEQGAAFLEENGKKEGVLTTESGLQYKVITQGEGPMPVDTSNVTVHYEGKLIDGSIFDSSYERGEPTSFALNRVIKGWTEGLKLMNAGSTYELYIPSNLGYGPRGMGADIPGNSVLIFKVELISIN